MVWLVVLGSSEGRQDQSVAAMGVAALDLERWKGKVVLGLELIEAGEIVGGERELGICCTCSDGLETGCT